MKDKNIKILYKKFAKAIDNNIFLCKKLSNLVDYQKSVNFDVYDKNIFYLDLIFDELFNIKEKLNNIIVDDDYIEKLNSGKIINLNDYSLCKEDTTVYVDLNNPIDITLFDN